jgi:hypothetical protein
LVDDFLKPLEANIGKLLRQFARKIELRGVSMAVLREFAPMSSTTQ